jgi:hypothetical protein
MGRFHLTTRWGDSVDEPSLEQMREALAELDVEDVEHPDTWLEHESGWSLSAFEVGLLWQNIETDEPPRHIKDVTRERVLELWLKLAEGKVAEIDAEPWLPGNGATPFTEEQRMEWEAEQATFRLQQAREFYDSLGPERPDSPCAQENCSRGAIHFSLFCRKHHCEMMWKHECPFAD